MEDYGETGWRREREVLSSCRLKYESLKIMCGVCLCDCSETEFGRFTMERLAEIIEGVCKREGMNSISGANQPVAIGTGKLIKHLNIPVYYYRCAFTFKNNICI